MFRAVSVPYNIVITEVWKDWERGRARDVGLKWKRGVTQGNDKSNLRRYLDMFVDTVSIRQHFVGYFMINPP